MKTETYHGRFCMYFADDNSKLRITLSFTNATNEYCKDEPCKGNLETLSVLYPQSIYLFVCSMRERERERERGTIHSSREPDTFT